MPLARPKASGNGSTAVACVLSIMALVGVGIASSSPALATRLPTVVVTVGAAGHGARVPSRPLGLSFDVSTAARLARYSTTGNLATLLRDLGPGVLRLSGNSVDLDTAWVPSGGKAPAWATSTITPDDLRGIAKLSAETNWDIVLGIGLGHFNPLAAAREVATASRILGPHLLAIEIGNEPDEYPAVGIRSQLTWDYDRYLAEFSAYRTAILSLTPRVPIEGPDVVASLGSIKWISAFSHLHGLAALTAHYYPFAACGPARSASTIHDLLDATTLHKTQVRLSRLGAIARSAGLRLRVSEANSASCGGTAGVSNTFASALWTLTFLTQALHAGLSGVNFQTIPSICTGYSALCTPTARDTRLGLLTVEPQYYALLLARSVAGGRLLTSSVQPSSSSLDVTPFVTRNGQLEDLVVNTGSSPVRVTLKSGPVDGAATELFMQAPGLQAESGVTLGGTATRANGTWAPGPLPQLALTSHGAIAIVVPGASAVLVTETHANP